MADGVSPLITGAVSMNLALVLWAGFGLALMVFGVFSLILLWHWKAYSTGAYTTWGSMLVFLLGGTFFLSLMAAAALWTEAI